MTRDDASRYSRERYGSGGEARGDASAGGAARYSRERYGSASASPNEAPGPNRPPARGSQGAASPNQAFGSNRSPGQRDLGAATARDSSHSGGEQPLPSDASRYSRERYGSSSARSERRYSAAAPQRDARPAGGDAGRHASGGASSYSRDAASSRYAGRKRHASRGGRGIGDVAAAGAAALRGYGVGRALRNVLCVLLALLLAGAVAFYALVASALHASEDVSASVVAPTAGEPYYVLLLGSDSRSEDTDVARADSIMLVRVDEAEQQVSIISLPRDLMVEIEGHGTCKLNAALTYGGFSGAIDAVSELAGVEISYYATVYFSGFEQLVDALGGVTVEVPEGTYYKGVSVPAGDAVEITGEPALVLARCRHGKPADQGAYAAGDYQRTLNQRNLMKAIVKKIMSAPIYKMPGYIYTVAQCVETNMPAFRLIKLAFAMRGMDAEGMYTAVAPATSSYIGGVSYEVIDDDEWAAMLTRLKAGEDPNG